MPNLTPHTPNEGFQRFTHSIMHGEAGKHILTTLLALVIVALIAGALMFGANEGAASFSR